MELRLLLPLLNKSRVLLIEGSTPQSRNCPTTRCSSNGRLKTPLHGISFTAWLAGTQWFPSVSTSRSLPNHTQMKASTGKDVPATNGAIERHTFLLRPNTRYPDPRAIALLHTPTTTDVDSPSFETDSEVGDLASSIGSFHMAPNASAVLSGPPTLQEIGAEAGHEHELSDHEGYSSESSFAIIDKDGEAQEESVAQKNDDGHPRLLRTLDRPGFVPASGFTPAHLRSGSSPSRSPVRQRRPRPTRRGMTVPFSTLPTFRPPKEPTTSFWDFIFA